jgi:hypothetical protein
MLGNVALSLTESAAAEPSAPSDFVEIHFGAPRVPPIVPALPLKPRAVERLRRQMFFDRPAARMPLPSVGLWIKTDASADPIVYELLRNRSPLTLERIENPNEPRETVENSWRIFSKITRDVLTRSAAARTADSSLDRSHVDRVQSQTAERLAASIKTPLMSRMPKVAIRIQRGQIALSGSPTTVTVSPGVSLYVAGSSRGRGFWPGDCWCLDEFNTGIDTSTLVPLSAVAGYPVVLPSDRTRRTPPPTLKLRPRKRDNVFATEGYRNYDAPARFFWRSGDTVDVTNVPLVFGRYIAEDDVESSFSGPPPKPPRKIVAKPRPLKTPIARPQD